MHYHPESLIKDLSAKAILFRIQVLKMVFDGQTGHIGGAYSSAEILASLFFHHMQLDPTNPTWEDRDRLIFSKGHACAVLYAAMAYRGFFPISELMTFRKIDSRLQGHPDRLKLPGIEMNAGPLGHGIAVGTGIALALRMKNNKPSALSAPSSMASGGKVYVVVGDGELDAGIIWEGALAAAKYKLGNLTAIVDYNGIQQSGATADIMPTEDICEKWHSFGWHVQEIDGHNVGEILNALDLADQVHARPSVIIARTTKGMGVSLFEYDHRWHGAPPNKQQFELALAELEGDLGQWQN